MWTPSERRFLRSLNTPFKLQSFLDDLVYNNHDSATSPRYVMMSKDAHCLEGGLLAAATIELWGYRPLMISLQAENDDHHVITVYKGKKGWGSFSKSNTTLLRGRDPVYSNVRELVMSYFDFYFNLKGQKSLYAYSLPINLNHYNQWDWRTSDEDLNGLGKSFNGVIHYEILTQKELKALPRVNPQILKASYLGANLS